MSDNSDGEESKKEETTTGVKKGTFGRRAWDEQIYQQKALERSERERGGVETDEKRKEAYDGRSKILERKPLQARDSTTLLDIEQQIGKKGLIEVKPQSTKTEPKKNKTSTKSGEEKKVEVEERGGLYCSSCRRVFRDSASYIDHCNSKAHLARLGMTNRAERATLEDVKNRMKELARKKNLKSFETIKAPELVDIDKISSNTTIVTSQEDNELMKQLGFASFGTTSKK
ncbi:hypothetical protein ABK040_010094 [Willaertia magna]